MFEEFRFLVRRLYQERINTRTKPKEGRVEPMMTKIIIGIVFVVLGVFVLITISSTVSRQKFRRCWRKILGGVGGILIALGIVAVFWPWPKKISSCESYGIRIQSLRDEKPVTPDSDGSLEGGMSGTFKKEIPEGWELWIFSAYDKKHYRPKSPIELNSDGTWDALETVWIGKEPEIVDIAVLLMGKNGQALLQFHDDAIQYTRENKQSALYFPINTFTDDVHECAYITIDNQGVNTN